jgi:hypothetical protein
MADLVPDRHLGKIVNSRRSYVIDAVYFTVDWTTALQMMKPLMEHLQMDITAIHQGKEYYCKLRKQVK